MRLALTAAAAITPADYIENPVVVVEDDVIVALGSREDRSLPCGTKQMDFPGAVLAPGFIDLHVHGGAGFDVMSASSEGLAQFEAHLVRHGVTGYFPTTVTAPMDATLSALERLAARIEWAEKNSSVAAGAQPLGIHLEGPFISQARRGAHPGEHIQPPSVDLLRRFWEAARGRIKIMTIAPELPGALELIAEAAGWGVCVSLGHSDADYDCARAAISAGARHATHVFNAMRTLDHRDPGILAAVLTDARVSAEIICDGVHVSAPVIQIFLKAKGLDSAVLVSDAISATGMPDGRYTLGGFEVEVKGNRCVSAEGKLAGSVLTLDQAVRNVMEFAGCDLHHAVCLVTRNPARTAALGSHRGTLAPGGSADVVVLSRAGEVLHHLVKGRVA
jgi:N-acetylglucosamine-6-phosphate deacetylase